MPASTVKGRQKGHRSKWGHLKSQLNVRVSDDAHIILAELQERLGNLSKAEALEVLLHAAGREHGIDPAKLRLKHQVGVKPHA
jgi:hypothetical protein